MLCLVALLTLPASADETPAGPPAIDGWWQEVGSDKVMYYVCAHRDCGENSLVSFKMQKARTPVTLAEFESRYREIAERSKKAPGIRDFKISQSKERTIDGIQVLQITREMSWADGSTTFAIEARLFGDGRSFSLISGSAGAESAASNFEKFVPHIANLVASTGR